MSKKAVKPRVGTGTDPKMPTLIMVDPNRVRRFAKQPRKYFDPERLQALAESIEAHGLQKPVPIKRITGDPAHEYELIDGERRWRACMLLKNPVMLALIEDVPGHNAQFIKAIIGNFGNEGHTHLEVAHAIAEMLGMPEYEAPTKTARLERIARTFGRPVSWLYQHLNLLQLHPDVQAMMDPELPKKERLHFSIASYLGNNVRDNALQLKLAEDILAGDMKLNKARNFIRRQMQQAGQQSPGRGRKPSDEFAFLESFVERTAEGAEQVLETPHKIFITAFLRRSYSVRERMCAQMKESITVMQQLHDAMMRNILAKQAA